MALWTGASLKKSGYRLYIWLVFIMNIRKVSVNYGFYALNVLDRKIRKTFVFNVFNGFTRDFATIIVANAISPRGMEKLARLDGSPENK